MYEGVQKPRSIGETLARTARWMDKIGIISQRPPFNHIGEENGRRAIQLRAPKGAMPTIFWQPAWIALHPHRRPATARARARELVAADYPTSKRGIRGADA
jgi:hypothetical protein